LIKLILILFSFIILNATNIKAKIQQTKNKITYTKIQISNMNKKLDELIQNINKQKDILNSIHKNIDELNKKIIFLKKNLYISKDNLSKLKQKKELLEQKRNILKNKLIQFIIDNYTLQIQDITSEKNLIKYEILLSITQIANKKIQNILKNYKDITSQITTIIELIQSIKNRKKILENKKQQLIKLKKQQYKKIIELNNKKIEYKKKLKQLIQNQKTIQNQLEKLNIIQKRIALRAKKIRERNEYLLNHKITAADKIKIKDYGDLYMKTPTKKYYGEKTISPVKNGVIIKKFGSYIDPIYHISIYNDSITIKTKPYTKIRSIFNGKVIFVSKQHNNKMIVIKHKNNLYSIYAKLYKISPFIKKGYHVKKGEIIAKTDGEFEFEITYKTYPINPLQVINLK
jgi:septal ring factor EnvC (AmiA/AmiB activator)